MVRNPTIGRQKQILSTPCPYVLDLEAPTPVAICCKLNKNIQKLTLQRNFYVIQLSQSESFLPVRLVSGQVPPKMVSNNLHRTLCT
jgi:hypothetical protein